MRDSDLEFPVDLRPPRAGVFLILAFIFISTFSAKAPCRHTK
jgi:hypothetical protein